MSKPQMFPDDEWKKFNQVGARAKDKHWLYTNSEGEIQFVIYRLDFPDESKGIYPISYDGENYVKEQLWKEVFNYGK